MISTVESRLRRAQYAADEESLTRHKIVTARIILLTTDGFFCSTIAMLCLGQKAYFAASIWSLAVLWIIWDIKKCFDDDNWFKKQFQKLKQGLRNTGKKLGDVRLPSLTPAPKPI